LQFPHLLSAAVSFRFTFGPIRYFLNGEPFGPVTTGSLAMYFPLDPTGQLRHPSQLYEAFFEGIFLFIILWSVRKKRMFNGFHFCLYIISYGIVRFCVEFVREPNPGMGAIWRFFTMGQILSIAMILGSTFIILIKRKTTRANPLCAPRDTQYEIRDTK